jgi:acyl carrier protein
VCRVVAEVLGVEQGELVPVVSLVDDLAADSLDLVEIALGLEATLGVSMRDEVLDGVRTYGDLLAAVRRAGAARAAGGTPRAPGEGRCTI